MVGRVERALIDAAAKDAAERLAAAFVPGLGLFTGAVALLQLVKSKTAGNISGAIETPLRVPFDGRFPLIDWREPVAFNLLGLKPFDYGGSTSKDDNFILVRYAQTSFGKPTGKLAEKGYNWRTIAQDKLAAPFWGVGFKKYTREDQFNSADPEAVLDSLLKRYPGLSSRRETLAAGLEVTRAAARVSRAAEQLFSTKGVPNFSDTNPTNLVNFAAAMIAYASAVSTFGYVEYSIGLPAALDATPTTKAPIRAELVQLLEGLGLGVDSLGLARFTPPKPPAQSSRVLDDTPPGVVLPPPPVPAPRFDVAPPDRLALTGSAVLQSSAIAETGSAESGRVLPYVEQAPAVAALASSAGPSASSAPPNGGTGSGALILLAAAIAAALAL